MDFLFRKRFTHQPEPSRGSELSNQLPQHRTLSQGCHSVSSTDSSIGPDNDTSYASTSTDRRSDITKQEGSSGQLSSRSRSSNEVYSEDSIFYSSPTHFKEINTAFYGRSPSCLSFGQRNSTSGSTRSLGAFNHYCNFGLAEMKDATNNFDDSLIIGKGAFGKVYKGKMVFDDEEVLVAIKRWSSGLSNQTVTEFQSEIEKLLSVKHRNVVSLIGYCDENKEMILVYEYIPQGTLRAHIRRGNNSPMSWKDRLRICIATARGLHYLHTGTEQPTIHRDIKTANILLDDKFEAKIADFGLAREGPDKDQSHVSTVVKGTPGYLDPDYWSSSQLTEMSDVYSFGVVLLEVLTGLPPTDKLLSKSFEQPLSLARRHLKYKTLDQIIDPVLKRQIELRCLSIFSNTIKDCIAMDRKKRPQMGTVLHNLISAKQAQEKSENKEPLENQSILALHSMLRRGFL